MGLLDSIYIIIRCGKSTVAKIGGLIKANVNKDLSSLPKSNLPTLGMRLKNFYFPT